MRSDSGFAPHSSRRRALRASCVALLFFALAASESPAYGPHPRLLRLRRERAARLEPSIDEIVFVGNDTFDEKTLARYMETRESWFLGTRRYSARTLRKDLLNLERYYTTQGFLDAEVAVGEMRVSRDSSSVEILIDVREGARWTVTGTSFEGNEAIGDDELRGAVEVVAGGPLLTNALESDRRRLLAEYAARSFLDARVKQDVVLDEERKEAEIRYSIVEREPASVGAIEIQGNEKTREYVVRREIEFEPGELFDYEKVGDSQAELYRTGLFHSVWIEPDPADTGKAVKNVIVRVNERPSGSLELGVGYAAIDGFEIGGRVVDRNVQGQSVRLGLDARFSELARTARVTVTDPWFLGVPLAVDVVGGYEHHDEESFLAETSGGRFVLTKTFTPSLSVSGGYEFERTVVIEAVEGAEEEGANYTSDLLLALTHDTRDDILNARRGALARGEVSFASSRLGGTNDFVRTELELRGYKRLHRRTVGAAALRVGWIKSQGGGGVPVNERYFAGGEGSVRGFDRNTLAPLGPEGDPRGGRAIVELRAEARFRVLGGFGVAVFADAGRAYYDLRSSRIDELAVGAGGGLRYETRIGVLRLDVAAPLTERGPARLYVSVGQAF